MKDGVLETTKKILGAHGQGAEALVPVLRAIQNCLNHIPPESLSLVADGLGISPARVSAVVTFYHQFRLQPAGTHFVKVCIGTACHVKGAEAVFRAFLDTLDIAEGEDTDSERLFTVEKVACLGCCMLAPAVQIDDVTYGFVTPARAREVLTDFLSEHAGKSVSTATLPDHPEEGREVRICQCSSCLAAGAGEVADAARKALKDLAPTVPVRSVGCTGISFEAPLLEIEVAGGQIFRYGRVPANRVGAILRRHFQARNPFSRTRGLVSGLLERLYARGESNPVTRHSLDDAEALHAYVAPQRQRALEHAGAIDPLCIDAYRDRGGLQALAHVVQADDPEQTIGQLEAYGLRGRGGGGFPTARKWRTVLTEPGPEKYVICNADEGDPGAFMDRMILESFPFRVVEGLVIAGLTVGARSGFVYVRSEYPLAVQRLRQAVEICESEGILGDSVLGGKRSFHLEVREGAGAFVCGEETALIASLEGRRGMPRVRPPYPSECGFRNCPTLINNVETLASVPWILRAVEGDDLVGTAQSRGTKVFALAGKVQRGGLVEVPMGMTLREIVQDVGGGVEKGRTLKAVQVGGPSGGCVPAALCDTPVDYEALRQTGAMMGSGGLVVLDETDCMVDVARYFMTFTQSESCGKCTFCRIGTKRMLEILERLCAGEGRQDDIEQLERLAEMTRTGSLCGLGRTAPNPVLSTLAHFRGEYEAHVEGRCPAGTCKKLITYSIGEECIGCTRCAQRCPADAIQSIPHEKHVIDAEKCVRCDACRETCPVDAVHIR